MSSSRDSDAPDDAPVEPSSEQEEAGVEVAAFESEPLLGLPWSLVFSSES